MDKSSLLGVTLALGGILLGLVLEGGRVAQIIRPTAAMIVFGGTLGAVMIQFPLRVIFAAALRLGQVFVDNSQDPNLLIQAMVGYAQTSPQGRHHLSRLANCESIHDPFLKKSLMLAVDGTEPQEIRKMMRTGTGQPERTRGTSSKSV